MLRGFLYVLRKDLRSATARVEPIRHQADMVFFLKYIKKYYSPLRIIPKEIASPNALSAPYGARCGCLYSQLSIM